MEAVAPQEMQEERQEQAQAQDDGPVVVPSIVGEGFLPHFFEGLTGDEEMAEKVIAASSRLEAPLHALALALTKLYKAKGRDSLLRYLNRRGRRPLRSFLVATMAEEMKALPDAERREGIEEVLPMITPGLSMSQWQRRFVEPACESFETVPRSMTRAAVKASIVVRHKELPVQDSKVQQLRGAKLLTRNVSLTIISAIAELVWTRAAPIVLSVHDELFAQCIMLLVLAFMTRYKDEVSIRTAVGAVRDLATEVEHLVDQ